MTTDTPALDLSKLDGVTLTTGHHDIGETSTGCAMDAIAWATSGETTDFPSCVHPLLANKVQQLNDDDRHTETDRWRLVREAGPTLVETNKWEAKRVCLVIADAGRTVSGFIEALMRSADADLRSVDLSFVNLCSVNLWYADLSYADLRSAKLRSANLRSANLRSADLRQADLRSANLRSAKLGLANLCSADLSFADLSCADLRFADLRQADLSYATASRNTTWPDGFTVPDSVKVDDQ